MPSHAKPPAPLLGRRALNRATLARQLLLRRERMGAEDAVAYLVGLQAQSVQPPYYQLLARIADFGTDELAELIKSRRVVRIVTLRSTLHAHTATDARALSATVQPARDREVKQFRKGLAGVDHKRLLTLARALVEEEPRTPAQIREAMRVRWPGADPQSLFVAVRCGLPLVQVTPRGVWGSSGQVRLTTLGKWLGQDDRDAQPAPIEEVARRYLAAFGPASVQDMQRWSGLTGLRPAFERLRSELVVFRDEGGVELFDLPEAPRPDEDTPAPPRFLPEYDNVLLSHRDRTRIVPAEAKGRLWKGNVPNRALLVDGFLAGIWNLRQQGGAAVLTVEAFRAFTEAQTEEVAAEGERLLGTMSPAGGRRVRFGPLAAPPSS
ncbi:winged helix DNA-binding domain-containing protein [Streptomyces sp. NPDC006879]|uniref:winged helix DNA-binding domain-containing protein n=1 Tax=Streptomyces sp. NPDC006879 TaxID=3364767 RepID=UPI0036AF13C9